MRLIDADALMEELQEQMKTATNPLFAMVCDKCIDYLEKQPTAYDVEKVVAELEEKQQKWKTKLSESDTNYMDNAILKQYISHYDIAIEIVRKGGVE